MPAEVTLLILVLLAVLAAAGHGIWVATAWFLRGLAYLLRRPAHPCPHCGAERARWESPCTACGWGGVADRLPQGAGPLRDECDAVRRMLARLRHRACLDEATVARVEQAMAEALKEDRLPRGLPYAGPVLAPPETVVAEPVEAAAEEELPLERDEGADGSSPPPSVPWTDRMAALRRLTAGRAEPPAPPSAPASWHDWLLAFLERKNIRLGEIVGGLLIVGCSIALVVSFWTEIAARPWLKYTLFNMVTAGLFAVGIYAHRRWRLPTTSSGVLTIALLLVPLNFLAIAAFTRDSHSASVLVIGAELLSLAVFAMLVPAAGRILVPAAPLEVTVGVLGISAGELLVRRLVGSPPSELALHGAALLILAPYLISIVSALVRRRGEPPDVAGWIGQVLVLLALVTFAAVLALGLLLIVSGEPTHAARRLAPTLLLAALPSLAAGLTGRHQLPPRAALELHVAAATVAVLGAFALLLVMVLAFPHPARTATVSAVSAALLFGISRLFALPVACVPGWVSIAYGSAFAFHALRGDVAWFSDASSEVIAALSSASTGTCLAAIAGAALLVAAYHNQRRRPLSGFFHAVSAGGIAVASLVLATWYGLGRQGDPDGVRWLYLVGSLSAFAVAQGWPRMWFVWLGTGLLLLSLIQSVVYAGRLTLGFTNPWPTAFLLHASLCAIAACIIAAASGTIPLRRGGMHFRILGMAAVLASLVGLGGAIVPFAFESIVSFGVRCAWCAAIWLTFSLASGAPAVFSGMQLLLTLAAMSWRADRFERESWYEPFSNSWLDPRFLLGQGIVLVALALGWETLRAIWRGYKACSAQAPVAGGFHLRWPHRLREALDRLLLPAWPPVDLAGLFLAVGLLVLVAVSTVAPGVMVELAPNLGSRQIRADGTLVPRERLVPDIAEFTWSHIPPVPGGISNALILAGLASLAFLMALWRRYSLAKLAGVWLAVWGAFVSAPAWYASQVAVASALRWSMTVFLMVASAMIWSQGVWRWMALRGGWPGRPSAPHAGISSDAMALTGLTWVLALGPLAAMATYIGAAAWMRFPPTPDMEALARWLGVGWALSLLAWLIARKVNPAGPFLQPVGESLRIGTTLAPVLVGIPFIACVAWVVALSLRQVPLLGPDPDSVFARMGSAASHAIPLAAMTVTLCGFAWRDRAGGYAFAAAMTAHLTATVAFFLRLAAAGRPLDAAAWIEAGQLNAIVAAVSSLAWLAARRAAPPDNTTGQGNLLFTTQIATGLGLHILHWAPAMAEFVAVPQLPETVFSLPTWWGWAAWLLTFAALLWFSRDHLRLLPAGIGAAMLTGTATLAAATAAAQTGSIHVGSRTWLVLLELSSAALLAAGCWARRQPALGNTGARLPWGWLVGGFALQRPVTAGVLVLSLMAFFLALRIDAVPPRTVWLPWTVGGLVGVFANLAGLVTWTARRRYGYLAALVFNLAAMILWYNAFAPLTLALDEVSIFLLVNALALALAVPLWIVLDRTVDMRRAAEGRTTWAPPLARAASWAAIWLGGLGVGLDLANEPFYASVDATGMLALMAVLSLAAALFCRLWERHGPDVLAAWYALGLIVLALGLDRLNLAPSDLGWSGLLFLAAYGVGTSYLWRQRGRFHALAARFHMRTAWNDETAHLHWLVPTNVILAGVVTVLATVLVLAHPLFAVRVAAGQAITAQAFTVGLLAYGTRRTRLQTIALLLGVLGGVALAWAGQAPGSYSANPLHRAASILCVIAVFLWLYGLGLGRFLPRHSEWAGAARRLVPGLALAGVLTLAYILAAEVAYFMTHREVPMAGPAILAVVGGMGGLIAALLVGALVPGRHLLGMSERGRTVYVYAAEGVLACLLLHLRLTVPHLFGHPWIRYYWPILILVLAFLGAGLSELLARQRRLALAEPLANTGMFLPLLPLIGFWFSPDQVHYSVILVLAGALYAMLSLTRRSFGLGILAVLASNGGLWYFLSQHHGFLLVDHPQLWMIPVALSLLVAAYVHRERLSGAQLSAIRYFASITIYVSSTAEIVIHGVAHSPVLPLILGGLSILGVFAGIAMRAKAFLTMGLGFLVLAIGAVILHAQLNLGWTWLWYLAGIITGVLIIAMFALFEKKREGVLRMMDALRRWEH